MKKNAAKEVDDALSWLVKEVNANALKPDEFTVEMAYEKLDRTITKQALRARFQKMVEGGTLTVRKTLLGGKKANVWERIKP